MSILKSMIRRQVMGVAALGLAIGTGAFDELRAADFPSETVRIVVPFSAGSGTDLMTRRVADDLGHRLKGNFVVENVAGASGQIAATQVARAKPNGYTLFFTTNTTHSANPSLFKIWSRCRTRVRRPRRAM